MNSMKEIKINKNKERLRVLSYAIYNVMMSLLETPLTVTSDTLPKEYFPQTSIRPTSIQIYETHMSEQRQIKQ